MEQQHSILPTMTFEQLQALMVTAIEAAKKPDPETAAKLQAEKDRAERAKAQMVATIMAERQTQLCMWGKCDHKDKRSRDQGGECVAIACDHRKMNGQPYRGGQVFSDGIARIICGKCFDFTYEGPAPAESRATGFGIPA